MNDSKEVTFRDCCIYLSIFSSVFSSFSLNDRSLGFVFTSNTGVESSLSFHIILISAANLLERLISVCKFPIAANFMLAMQRLLDYKVLTFANIFTHLFGLTVLYSLNQT